MRDIYVGTGGDNLNDGLSYRNRFLTIEKAFSVFTSGDTIITGGLSKRPPSIFTDLKQVGPVWWVIYLIIAGIGTFLWALIFRTVAVGCRL